MVTEVLGQLNAMHVPEPDGALEALQRRLTLLRGCGGARRRRSVEPAVLEGWRVPVQVLAAEVV
jgi:hypothetical protein